MSPDKNKIKETILDIENAINARWNNGDCTGFLEAYREDVTYFDPLTDRCLCLTTTVFPGWRQLEVPV